MTDEPFYVRQTFEREHCADPQAWIDAVVEEAVVKGFTFPRVTLRTPDGSVEGILFEGWAERPKDQGLPRWALTEMS